MIKHLNQPYEPKISTRLPVIFFTVCILTFGGTVCIAYADEIGSIGLDGRSSASSEHNEDLRKKSLFEAGKKSDEEYAKNSTGDLYSVPDPCTLPYVTCGSESQRVTVTAYTSRPEETDDSPEVAANGSNIWKLYQAGENTCASNDHPFGTKLTIEGLGTCTVADRMNRRYTGTGRVDWYMGYDLESARQWGIRTVEVTIVN